jgi:glycosyltransferase involved in cell wall biosynthesis
LQILHVSPSFYPAWEYGGIPRCAYELCRALARAGESVTVWTTDALDATRRVSQREATVDGMQVSYFPNVSNSLAYHAQLYLPRGLAAAAREHLAGFDVVHIHSHRHALQLLVAAAARRAGVPYVFTGNGTVPLIERRVIVKRLVDALGAHTAVQQAAACVAVSGAEVEHYRAAGVTTERIAVIPNGVRLEEFTTLPAPGTFRRAYAAGDGPLVLFVGKITPRKGLDLLIRALARLPADVRLVVVGNFMMPAGGIHRLARELGVGERVQFVGALDGADKLAAYVDADVVAYPSVHEIFGLVPFEALMCGTPVVVCDDSGCGETVQAARGGLLVRHGDPQALADALARLLGDEELRRSCVRSGREYTLGHLGWDQIAEVTRALYGRIRERSARAAVLPVETAARAADRMR